MAARGTGSARRWTRSRSTPRSCSTSWTKQCPSTGQRPITGKFRGDADRQLMAVQRPSSLNAISLIVAALARCARSVPVQLFLRRYITYGETLEVCCDEWRGCTLR